MSLSYASKISSPRSFIEDMKITVELLIIVNRQDIILNKDRLVLTKPPLKVYGITDARYISFTYSTVDEIPSDILTAHIGINAHKIILEHMILQIDHCFFTKFVLPLGGEFKTTDHDQILENLMNPEYKDLWVKIHYSRYYYSDNPVLLNDNELGWYSYADGDYQWKYDRVDLERIISYHMVQLASSPDAWNKFGRIRELRKKIRKAENKQRRAERKIRIINFFKPAMRTT